MLYGKDYVALSKGRISSDDVEFWTYVELDICQIAEEKYNVSIEKCTDYVSQHKASILQKLSKAESPVKDYLSIIGPLAYNIARSKRKTLEIDKDPSDNQNEDIGDKTGGIKIQENSDSNGKNKKKDGGEFDGDYEDEVLARTIKRINSYIFLTALEKQALVYKYASISEEIKRVFTEEGIRQMALRAILKIRLHELNKNASR